MYNLVAIDIGSSVIRAVTRCGNKTSEIQVREFPALAAASETETIAVADNTAGCAGKLAGAVKIIHPIANGVIVEYDAAAKLFSYILSAMSGGKAVRSAVLGIPYDLSEFEIASYSDIFHSLGVKKLYYIEKPLAAAAGMYILEQAVPALQHSHTNGGNCCMICDIGAGTIEISAVQFDTDTAIHIVAAESLRLSGDDLNEAVKETIRRNYYIDVSDDDIERLKCTLADVSDNCITASKTASVTGIDISTGLPVKCEVSSSDFYEPFMEHVLSINETINSVMDQIPLGLADTIRCGGMVLLGGGAAINGISDAVSNGTGLNVFIPFDNKKAVILGLAAISADMDSIQTYAKNIGSIL